MSTEGLIRHDIPFPPLVHDGTERVVAEWIDRQGQLRYLELRHVKSGAVRRVPVQLPEVEQG